MTQQAVDATQMDNLPAITSPDDVNLDFFTGFAQFNTRQLAVLKEITIDLTSGNIRSDAEIARHLGISANTMSNYRANPAFSQAMCLMTMGVVRGKVDVYVRMLEKHGAKDWHALKFLLEFVGLHVQKSQQTNININSGTKAVGITNADVAVNAVLTRLGELGWSEERLVERFRALKTENAW